MTTALKERKRAVSVSEIYAKKFNVLPFKDNWLESFGAPELTGTWLVWGLSGNGKTRFVLQLCKYLASLGKKVCYNSLEEGASLSMRNALMEIGFDEVKNRFWLLDAEPIDLLIERLKKRKSPDVIAIDSVQYTGMNYKDYKALRDLFPKKMFILISHAEGKNPSSRVANSIKFDAFVKVRVEGYKAFPVSRYGGGEPFVIWEEGASNYFMD